MSKEIPILSAISLLPLYSPIPSQSHPRPQASSFTMYRFNVERIYQDTCPDFPIMQNHGPISPPPGPRPTPFYIAARTSPTIELSFIIQGMGGETMPFPVDTMDLAFILQRTLKRKGWKDQTIHGSVLGFLETPLLQVQKRGKEGEIVLLNQNQ